MDSLQGHFLIATPQMSDPRFVETVIYLCTHDQEGAMGLVINCPLQDVRLEDIFRHAAIPLSVSLPGPVYLGGPVENSHVFILYSADYSVADQLRVSSTVSLTSDPRLLHDLGAGRGPASYLVTLGYAGWGAGQLESELSVDGWLVLPAVDEIIFATPDQHKWRQAALVHGIDVGLFGTVSGSA